MSHSGKRSRLAAEEILRFAQNDERGTRLIGIILTVLLAITMLPAAGLQSAFADEPVDRPATTGGDAALEGYAVETAPVATQRDDGMYVADGLVYTVTDGGLSLVGFDGLPQGEDAAKGIVVPEAVTVDGKDTAVVAVAIAEGNVAEGVVSLTLPQSINNIDTATLAAALPNLASVEVAAPKASSAPVAAGAAAIKAAYSSFGGILYKNVRVASESDAFQTTLTKKLVWAPPATVVARIPAECTSIVSGAFADVKDLKTVVCFGVMEDIVQAQKADDGTITPGAFTDEQIATVNVIVPQTGTVVSDGDRVSADVAVTDDSTMDVKRGAWWQSGFASDRITLGEVYGSTTNTLPVTEEGVLETAEAEVAYAPETTQNSSSRKAGIEPPESAIPTPVPDDDDADSSESGLVFTHLADMTLSVSWKGDPTATPSHIDIPAYATINGVAYPVTEIAPHAFEGAAFLTSVAIPEGVTAIGDSAFAGCSNLTDVALPSTLKSAASDAFDGSDEGASVNIVATTGLVESPVSTTDTSANTEDKVVPSLDEAAFLYNDAITAYTSVETKSNSIDIAFTPSAAVPALSPSNGGVASGFSVMSKDVAVCTLTNNTRFTNPWYVGFMGHKYDDAWVVVCGDTAFGTSSKCSFNAPSGWKYIGTSVLTESDDVTGIMVHAVRDEAAGGSELALATDVSSKLSKFSDLSDLSNKAAARTNLGLGTLATKSSLAISDVTNLQSTLNGKQDKLGANAYASYATQTKVESADAGNDALKKRLDDLAGSGSGSVASQIEGAFGEVEYQGLDGVANGSAFPEAFRRGHAPAIPAPEREGYEFAGWTWAGQASPVLGHKALEDAFGDAAKVTLTANWKESTKGQNCFFADAALDSTASGAWTSTIAVRLTSDASKTSVSGLSFAANDLTGLLKRAADGSLPDVAFAVGSTKDGVTGSYGFGGSPTGTVQLADMDGGKGIYVRITIPAGGIDESRVVGSMTADDYVASIARMTYSSIA